MSLLNTFGQSTVGHVGHVMKSFYTAEVEAFFGMPRNLLLRVLSGAKGCQGQMADHCGSFRDFPVLVLDEASCFHLVVKPP